jgi:hypothetical protein
MSGTLVLLLDRHVLSSGPALVDSGKDTFAWTPGLAGERVARLKNEVPWGVTTAGAETPPRLDGKEVLSEENYLRLHFAWIPLDGRMGFCVWGAVGERPQGRSVWRVLTHTTLFDEQAFLAVAGNPFALLKAGVAGDWFRELAAPGSFDERGPVEPIRLTASPEAREIAEKLCRGDIVRLRARLRDLLGADDLARRLAALYATLASVPRVPHVALEATPDRRSEMLVRLAWLTLSPVDRWKASFSTEQGASASALPRLMALDLTEWQGRLPPDTFLFQGEPPPGIVPSPALEKLAGDVAHDDALQAYEQVYSSAAAGGKSLLEGDWIDRFSRYHNAEEGLRAGGRGMKTLQQLADPQHPGLLRPALEAGLLLGLSVRDPALTPDAAAEGLQQVLGRLPADGRDLLVRGMVRALALEQDAAVLAEVDAAGAGDGVVVGDLPPPSAEHGPATRSRTAAGLLRCRVVLSRQVSAMELERLLPEGPEQVLVSPLMQHPEGPAALLEAVFAADQGALLARLAPLAKRIPAERMAAVLGRLEARTQTSAEWLIGPYLAAEKQGKFLPSADMLRRLLPFATHARVRDYLARPELLPTVLASTSGGLAGAYIRAVGPDPRAVATALMDVIRREGNSTDDGVINDALEYLATSKAAGGIVDAWIDGEDPDARLFLLSHPAWRTGPAGSHALTTAAVVVERALSSAAATPGPAPVTVNTAVKQVLSTGAGALSAVEERLVLAGITFLGRRGTLPEPSSQLAGLLQQRVAGPQAAQLALCLAEVADGSSDGDAAIHLSHSLLRTMLQGAGQDQANMLRWLLGKLPPGADSQYWSKFLHAYNVFHLAQGEVLAALAASLQGRERAPLAGIVVKRVVRQIQDPTAVVLDALDRLAWTELMYLDQSSLGSDVQKDVTSRVKLLVQLLVRPATFPLSLRITEELRRFVAPYGPERWGGIISDDDLEALKTASPSIYELLSPRARREKTKKQIFVPENFKVNVPAPITDVERGDETIQRQRKGRKPRQR